jgi:hypothetical protein
MYNFNNNKDIFEKDIVDKIFIGFYHLINNILISINGKESS